MTNTVYPIVLLSLVALLGFAAPSLRRDSHHPNHISKLVVTAFEKFKLKYNKAYSTPEEEAHRLEVFNDFFHRIKKVADAGTPHFTVGITKFADLTREEFRQKYIHGFVPSTGPAVRLDTSNLKAGVDWVAKGAVTPVKNQGQCGSSPYFGAVVSMEGANFISSGQLISLSEQQILDCSGDYGNYGCNGGWMNASIQYAVDNGMETEDDYPYAGTDQNCTYDPSKVSVKPKGLVNVVSNDQDQLAAAISLTPVATAVEADQEVFQGYTGGVLTTGCGQQPDHGIAVVGFDTTSSPAFFKLKNSWGADWGENGYIRIEYKVGKKDSGTCAVASFPAYATF